jgi:predicted PurR-regulated permease PerM
MMPPPELHEATPPDRIEPPASSGGPVSYPTLNQQRLLWNALTALAVTTMLGVAGLVFFGFISFLTWSYSVLLPIGLAVIVALLLEPVVDFFQKRGLHRQTATLGVCLCAVVGFILFWAFLLPPLVSQTGTFFNSLPGWIDAGVDKLQNLGTEPILAPTTPTTNAPGGVSPGTNVVATPAPVPAPTGRRSVKPPPPHRPFVPHSEIHDWIQRNLPSVQESVQSNVAHLVYTAMGPVGQALGFVLGFGFVPIYVFYFLADQERIAKHWDKYVPLRESPLRHEVISVVTEINQVLVKYFRGQIIVAGCNGVLTCIGLSLVQIPYALVLGIMTGALSIVPFLGIIASILPALLLGFLSSGSWVKPLLVLVVFAVVQMSESMFITPRVQSHSTGLHPLTIIIGILFWSMLLPGLLGPVMAVPLTCAVVVLLRRYVWETKADPQPVANPSEGHPGFPKRPS